MKSQEIILSILRRHKKGIWIRALARKAKISPATVCNHLYGYYNNSGDFVPPSLKNQVRLKKYGDSSVTLVFLK